MKDFSIASYNLKSYDRVQDTLSQNTALWHTEYSKLKECEKKAEV